MVEAYGSVLSLLPLPLKPFRVERSGKATWSMPAASSVAVAVSWNEPEPAGRK